MGEKEVNQPELADWFQCSGLGPAERDPTATGEKDLWMHRQCLRTASLRDCEAIAVPGRRRHDD